MLADLVGNTQYIALCDVLYLPDLEKNLLSVHAIVKLGASVKFDSGRCQITQNSKLLPIGEMQWKLYILKIVPDENVYITRETSNTNLWHCCFCHLGMET